MEIYLCLIVRVFTWKFSTKKINEVIEFENLFIQNEREKNHNLLLNGENEIFVERIEFAPQETTTVFFFSKTAFYGGEALSTWNVKINAPIENEQFWPTHCEPGGAPNK